MSAARPGKRKIPVNVCVREVTLHTDGDPGIAGHPKVDTSTVDLCYEIDISGLAEAEINALKSKLASLYHYDHKYGTGSSDHFSLSSATVEGNKLIMPLDSTWITAERVATLNAASWELGNAELEFKIDGKTVAPTALAGQMRTMKKDTVAKERIAAANRPPARVVEVYHPPEVNLEYEVSIVDGQKILKFDNGVGVVETLKKVLGEDNFDLFYPGGKVAVGALRGKATIDILQRAVDAERVKAKAGSAPPGTLPPRYVAPNNPPPVVMRHVEPGPPLLRAAAAPAAAKDFTATMRGREVSPNAFTVTPVKYSGLSKDYIYGVTISPPASVDTTSAESQKALKEFAQFITIELNAELQKERIIPKGISLKVDGSKITLDWCGSDFSKGKDFAIIDKDGKTSSQRIGEIMGRVLPAAIDNYSTRLRSGMGMHR